MSTLERFLECSVCLGQLNVPKRLPRCPHVFCANCIRPLIGLGGAAFMLRCPVCRCNQKIPRGNVDSLVTDVNIVNLIDDLKCRDCHDVSSTVKQCSSCMSAACSPCLSLHSEECMLLERLRDIRRRIPSQQMKADIREQRGKWVVAQAAVPTLIEETRELDKMIALLLEKRDLVHSTLSNLIVMADKKIADYDMVLSCDDFPDTARDKLLRGEVDRESVKTKSQLLERLLTNLRTELKIEPPKYQLPTQQLFSLIDGYGYEIVDYSKKNFIKATVADNLHAKLAQIAYCEQKDLIYVSNGPNVHVFKRPDTFSYTIRAGITHVRSLAINSRNELVALHTPNCVRVFDRDHLINEFHLNIRHTALDNYIVNSVVSQGDSLYFDFCCRIVDAQKPILLCQFEVYKDDGTPLRVITVNTTTTLITPTKFAVCSNGYIFVSDINEAKIFTLNNYGLEIYGLVLNPQALGCTTGLSLGQGGAPVLCRNQENGEQAVEVYKKQDGVWISGHVIRLPNHLKSLHNIVANKHGDIIVADHNRVVLL